MPVMQIIEVCRGRAAAHVPGRGCLSPAAIGLLDLMFEAITLEADQGLTLTAYTAKPGTPSHDGLRLLASWAATHHRDGVAQISQDDRMHGAAP